MKVTVIALSLTALSVICGPTGSAVAGDKVATGTITTIGGKSLTVKVGDRDLAFSVDSGTVVVARGAGSKTARLAAAGKPGPHLNDVLQPGQSVAITYSEMAGALRASEIKATRKAPSDSNAGVDTGLRSTGIVKSMGGDWITIGGRSGGGASFEQTFKVDAKTLVFARGAGSAAAANGGRAPFTDLLTSGDHVIVSYRRSGNQLLASDVHVTQKASH